MNSLAITQELEIKELYKYLPNYPKCSSLWQLAQSKTHFFASAITTSLLTLPIRLDKLSFLCLRHDENPKHKYFYNTHI